MASLIFNWKLVSLYVCFYSVLALSLIIHINVDESGNESVSAICHIQFQ